MVDACHAHVVHVVHALEHVFALLPPCIPALAIGPRVFGSPGHPAAFEAVGRCRADALACGHRLMSFAAGGLPSWRRAIAALMASWAVAIVAAPRVEMATSRIPCGAGHSSAVGVALPAVREACACYLYELPILLASGSTVLRFRVRCASRVLVSGGNDVVASCSCPRMYESFGSPPKRHLSAHAQQADT